MNEEKGGKGLYPSVYPGLYRKITLHTIFAVHENVVVDIERVRKSFSSNPCILLSVFWDRAAQHLHNIFSIFGKIQYFSIRELNPLMEKMSFHCSSKYFDRKLGTKFTRPR